MTEAAPCHADPYYREGNARVIQEAVQGISDDADAVDTIIADTRAQLRDKHDGREHIDEALLADVELTPKELRRKEYLEITREYSLARSYRKIVTASIGLISCPPAFEQMTDAIHDYASLRLPASAQLRYNAYGLANAIKGVSPAQNMWAPAYHQAMNKSYWLVKSVAETLEAIADKNHPYHALHKHIAPQWEGYKQTRTAWSRGPGNNRWPHQDPNRMDGPAEYSMLSSITSNMTEGLDHAQAYYAHHHLFIDSSPSSEQVLQGFTDRLPLVNRATSVNRHMTWRPDWRRVQGFVPGMRAPHCPDLRLMTAVRSRDYEKQEIFLKLLQQFDPLLYGDFCPHPQHQHRALEKWQKLSWRCCRAV